MNTNTILASLLTATLLAPAIAADAPPSSAPASASAPAVVDTAAFEKRLHDARDLAKSGHARALAKIQDLLADLKAAFVTSPKNARLAELMGEVYWDLEDPDHADAMLAKAVELAPREIAYRLVRAQFQLEHDESTEAEATLNAAAKVAPNDLMVLRLLVAVQQRLEHMEDCLASARKIVELDAKNAASHEILGEALVAAGKLDDALASFREALKIDPKHTISQTNIGQVLQSQGKYAESKEAYESALKDQPDDYRILSKLVQNNTALGKFKDLDETRAKIFALKKDGKIDADFYCREQFTVAGQKVMAMEHFELKGDMAVRYVFLVLDKAGTKMVRRISLGSYATTNAIARESGEIGKDERIFHLDGYTPNGHATYGMFKKEPAYDDTRAIVVSILEGKTKPMSSTVVGEKQPGTQPGK